MARTHTRTEESQRKRPPRRRTIKLYWLGSPRIVIDGNDARLEIRKAIALVAYLSVSRQSHSREFLSTLLWPDYDQSRAHANLRQCILQIKRKLGHGFIKVHRGSVGLEDNPDLWIDTEDFNRSRTSLDSLLRAHGPPDREGIAALEHAVDVYRGDFLEGFNLSDCPEFDLWQTFQREGLNQKLSQILERLIEGYSSVQEWEKGIQHCLRWLWADRSNESAHRTLMLLYSRAGRKSAAVRQYQDCVKILKEDLGVSPEPRTTELHDRIRRGCFDELKKDAAPTPTAATPPKPSEALRTQKVSIPVLQGEFVPRPQLLAKLDSGLQVPFALISAPAGFGKTTLLADWAHRIERDRKTAVSWFSVDHLDNDPVRFLTNLGLSLDTTLSDVAEKASTLLQAIPTPSFDTMMEKLTFGLRERSIPTVIIVDDFHFITNAQIHDGMATLIEYLPPTVHLFLSTRSDPLFAVSRLRLRKRIVELRTDDLRFRRQEVDSYLNKLKGLGLTREELATLETKTEGWVVGLQIATHSFDRKQRDLSSIRSFGGNHRQIMDYLMEEVLERQDGATKDFLLKTSILDRMTDSLCRELTGLDECQSILEKLERSNLFIVSLDDRREWYRYHHLFMDVLRLRLQQSMDDSGVSRLHALAAHWYASRNLFDSAIQHGLAAKDYSLVSGLITQSFANKLARGELSTLLSWIGALPEEVVSDSHELCIAKAWALLLSGLVTQAEGFLLRAQQKSPVDQEEEARVHASSHVAALSAYIAESRGNDAKSVELALEGYKHLPEGDLLTRGIILFILGRLYRKAGELPAAEQAFTRITELGISSGIFWMQAAGVCDTASIKQIQGKLSEASEICRRCLQQIPRSGEPRYETFALVYFRFADVLYERNKLAEANRHITLGLSSIRGWTNPNDLAYGYIQLVRLRLASANLHGARSVLVKAEELRGKLVLHAHLSRWISFCRVHYELSAGNHREALRLARDILSVRAEGPLNQEFEAIEYCRVLVRCAEKEPGGHYLQEARSILETGLERAKSGERFHRFIQQTALQSVATYLAGQHQEALAMLLQALTRAEPEGHVRTFLDSGAPLAELLRIGKETNLWAAPELSRYVERLLEAFVLEKDGD